ncbi:MAG: class I SAM-dependent methyltransferase, partial [Actinobacteria bacterium]|nr:class I SAM-dependent methyltransferase [Actinomycetota bacterium]
MTEPSATNSNPVDESRLRVLERILREAQRIGALSNAPVAEIINHAKWFADAIPHTARTAVDLGSGAGVPGLIVALFCPHLNLHLVDRRVGRTDVLVRAVHALDLVDRVTVRCSEITDMTKDSTWAKHFDVAMSRGLGP